ncbi:unnamed protein product [Withania somnifera]
MACMVFASSPLSVQSLVKPRTNSNCPHSSCYLPSPSRAKNSYIHLSYMNISHIESSKSLFTNGDGNLSFSLPKFPRVASTLSTSLNIIKARSGEENIYHFKARDRRTGEYIQLSDRYMGKVLLIVNIPQESKYAKEEIELLNDLCEHYENKQHKGFEVLGFLHDKKDLKGNIEGEEKGLTTEEILEEAKFTIFDKVNVNNPHESYWRRTWMPSLIEHEINEDLWHFLRTTPLGDTGNTVKTINEAFEKFLIDGDGKPMHHWPRIPKETMKDMNDGGNPGDTPPASRIDTPLRSAEILQERIDKYFPEL